ncbi:MAG: dTDP-4-dehydrorhamnose 3,5-epimerase family protein [Candidatus Woesearchaeota archaeon]|jgi:dTDP-4-dehydrorhamnose 3,5-epimerase|nr:dTDP-4-dehydrorhamnose 3,5-epimerase family protein [Candidatus Woesearchaeota archaeon]
MDNNIEGVEIKELKTWEDERGWLIEIFREDEIDLKPAMAYVSHTKPGVVRGPHEHKAQTDLFVFTGYGDFELYLWDARKDSPTKGKHVKIVVGESFNATVSVPPGVVHGYKSISKNGSFSINLPDKLYAGPGKKEEVDEIRHENNKDSPYKIPEGL